MIRNSLALQPNHHKPFIYRFKYIHITKLFSLDFIGMCIRSIKPYVFGWRLIGNILLLQRWNRSVWDRIYRKISGIWIAIRSNEKLNTKFWNLVRRQNELCRLKKRVHREFPYRIIRKSISLYFEIQFGRDLNS